jgi:hypothetical protein
MSVLNNTKHELFAQALAKGMSAIRAYRAARYKPDRGAACRLSANVSVRARLNELLEKAAERTLVTVERVTAELEEARELAMSHPKGAAAALSASMSKAKLHGLLEERNWVISGGRVNPAQLDQQR